MIIEQTIIEQALRAFNEKVASLPTPPPGYYYAPSDNFDIRHEGEKYYIDGGIVLKPIIE